MIKIVAKNFVKAENVEKFLHLAEILISESRKESGCVSYSLYKDVNDNRVFTFIEEWKEQGDINNHNNSEHFTVIVPQLQELCFKAGEVNLYEEVRR